MPEITLSLQQILKNPNLNPPHDNEVFRVNCDFIDNDGFILKNNESADDESTFDQDLNRVAITVNGKASDEKSEFRTSNNHTTISDSWNQYLNLSAHLVTINRDFTIPKNPIKYSYDIKTSTCDIQINDKNEIRIVSTAKGITKEEGVPSKKTEIEGSIKTTIIYDKNRKQFKFESCVCSNEDMKKIAMGTINKPSLTKLDTSPQSSTEYPKPSFIKRIGNWCKRHPILTGLMIGVTAPLLIAGAALGIVALAHALPFLAPAALFIGGVAAIAYGALHVLGIVGVAATATAIAAPAAVGGTVGVSTGAIVQCSTAKVMGKTGANAKNKKSAIEGYVEFSKELNKPTNENKNKHTSSCLGILNKVFTFKK